MAKVRVKPNQKGRKQFIEQYNNAIQALTVQWSAFTQAQKLEALKDVSLLNLRAIRALLRQGIDD